MTFRSRPFLMRCGLGPADPWALSGRNASVTAQSMIGAPALTNGGELALQAHDDRVQRQAEDAVLVTARQG